MNSPNPVPHQSSKLFKKFPACVGGIEAIYGKNRQLVTDQPNEVVKLSI